MQRQSIVEHEICKAKMHSHSTVAQENGHDIWKSRSTKKGHQVLTNDKEVSVPNPKLKSRRTGESPRLQKTCLKAHVLLCALSWRAKTFWFCVFSDTSVCAKLDTNQNSCSWTTISFVSSYHWMMIFCFNFWGRGNAGHIRRMDTITSTQ